MAYAPTPDVVALVRRLYADGVTVNEIVAQSGIKNLNIIYRCVAGLYPDGSGVKPAPIPQRRQGVRVRHRKGSRTYGVNSGIARAAQVLRRLARASGDGAVDAALLAAVRKADAWDLIARLCDERLSFLKRLKTWRVFGAGWGRRVAQVRAAALVMAAGKPQPSAAAHSATAGGIATAGAAAAQQVHQAGARPIIVAAIFLATAALLVCVWLAWRWRHRQTAS